MTRKLILLALLTALAACGKQPTLPAASTATEGGSAANAIVHGLNIIGESLNDH